MLAAGGATASDVSAGGDEDAWDVGALAALDVPVVQGLCLTSARATWQDSDAALTPMDAAMQVAIPEFDGRLISVPFSFKETGPDDVPVYVADPERAARVAGIAVRHARLRHVPNADKRLAVVLSSYPTKHARVGNAVGLDTPASAVVLLRALREAGYDLGADGFPEEGDALIHRLIAAGGHDVEWLTEEQLAAAPLRVPLADYQRWFAALPPQLRESVRDALGRAARLALRQRNRSRRRDRAGGAAVRQRRARDPAAARLRREPGRDLPRPRPAAEPPLPRGVPLARPRASARTPSSTSASTARWNGFPARDSGSRPSARPTPCSATSRWSTRSSSTTRARGRRPSGARTRPSSTT